MHWKRLHSSHKWLTRITVYSEFGETLICRRLYFSRQPSRATWSVQLILCCVVYLNKLEKVFISEIHWISELRLMADSKLFRSVISLSSIKLYKLLYAATETNNIFAFLIIITLSVLRMGMKNYIRPSDISFKACQSVCL